MSRKKKDEYPNFGKFNILCYSEDDMFYYHGVPTIFDYKPEIVTYDWIEIPYKRTTISPYNAMEIQTNGFEKLDNIMLDDTTMKRIAKFNKTQECKRLDKEIKEKEERIKELDDLLQDKEKRWNKVKEYIKNIYEINLDEEDSDDYYDY